MIKILLGGSPCTYWSIAQTNNRETKAEGMGWELFKNYLIAKEKFKPDLFLYENNKSAAQAIKDQIAEEFGVGIDPDVRFTYINSALVSAQNRQRFYVTNFGDIEQPEDRGILLKDILETGQPRYDKSPCIDACYYKGGNLTRPECQSGQRLMACEPIYIGEVPEHKGTYRNGKQASQQYRVYSTEGKSIACDQDSRKFIPEPIAINATAEGDKARTLMAGYYKYGTATLLTNPGFTGGTTAVAEPVNTTDGGKAHTIKAQYYKNSAANFVTNGGFGASAVAEPLSGETGAKPGLYAIQADEPMRVKEATKQGYVDINVGDCVDLTQPNSKTRRGQSVIDKSNCLTTSHQQYEYCGVLGYATPIEWDDNGVPIKAVSCADGKTYTVYEVNDGQITIKGKQYPIKLVDGYYIIRKLTVKECARLQTMPDDYCKAVSDSQAYKALGNGWTAEVIIHLLNHALKDVPRDEEIVVLSMYDGIATGRYCLDKMGFTNVTYHAYEIDKYPIMVAMDNYPDIIQHGDAFQVREDGWKI